MNSQNRNRLNALATGVVVVILMSLGLFWARWFCAVQRADLLPEADRKAVVELPLSLSRTRVAEDPNASLSRYLTAEMAPPPPMVCLIGLGAPQYVEQHLPGGSRSHVYRWNWQPDGATSVYYDRSLGLMVYQGTEKEPRADGTQAVRRFTYYAGPEGIGSRPDEKLGQFRSPVADGSMLQPQIVYDRVLRRFFAIEWSTQNVRKGPELPPDDAHQPVEIRTLWRDPVSIKLLARRAPWEGQGNNSILLGALYSTEGRLLVLDASGRIDLLDSETLEFAGVAGRLASPAPLFGLPRPTRPEDVISYAAFPIGISRGDAGQGRTYAGCAVATVSRGATGLRLDVYDANGRAVGSDDMGFRPYLEAPDGKVARGRSIPSTKVVYSDLPGAEVLTIAQWTFENLHPPVFLLASYLAGPHLAATAGYQSLFLLPDSFVAMSARDAQTGLMGRVSRACSLASPAFLLSLLLVWRMTLDGARLGMSRNARVTWAAGIVMFGLPAYVTYRLTRPRVTLVTCANCGAGRRPDREKCQRCGSPWVVPELVPPAWRVLGEQEEAEKSSSSEAQQANLQTE
jgi:hypothetical protein